MIKPIKSELKIDDREIKLDQEIDDCTDLKLMDSNAIVNKLEASIKMRETPVDKRKVME